jgi:Ca2+-binding RTX toxin-like protein
MRGALVAAAAVLGATWVAPATAATVSVQDGHLVYQAAPGETNSPTVTDESTAFSPSETYGFTETATEAGPGCHKDAGYPPVRCDRAGVTDMTLVLGDLPDFAYADDVPVLTVLDGGEGNDNLWLDRGGLLDGGAGDDELVIERGSRAGVRGGTGRDLLRLSFDSLGYSGVPTGSGPLWVADLGTGRIGAAPHSSELSGVEDVVGSARGDRITGDDGPNTLDGFLGRDAILGAAGDDRLDGVDTYYAPDPHSVTSHYYPLASDALTCGAGTDRVRADVRDHWTNDCERVTVYGLYKRTGTNYDGDPEPYEAVRRVRVQLNGGAADDRLIGVRSVPNRISGRGGDDVIRGADRNDTLRGGAGDDTIDAADRSYDTIRCGDGVDTVHASRGDRIARNCEHVSGERKRYGARR